MQIGRVSYGYGTSRLWHDPDYTIQRPLYPHAVTRAIEQELPAQEHIAPPAPTDPYLAQEESYDVAFQQMERGLDGRDFLHGVKSDSAFDRAVQAKALDKTMVDGATGPQTLAQTEAATRTPSQPQLVHGIEDHLDIADEAIYQGQGVLHSQRTGRVESPEEAAVARAIEINRREGLPPPGQVQTAQGTRTAGYEESRQAAERAREHNRVTEAISLIQGTIASAATATVSAQAAQATVGTPAQGVVTLEGVMASGATAIGEANQASDAADLDQALRRRNEPTYAKVFKSLRPDVGATEVAARPLAPEEGTEQHGLSPQQRDELVRPPGYQRTVAESTGEEPTDVERPAGLPADRTRKE